MQNSDVSGSCLEGLGHCCYLLLRRSRYTPNLRLSRVSAPPLVVSAVVRISGLLPLTIQRALCEPWPLFVATAMYPYAYTMCMYVCMHACMHVFYACMYMHASVHACMHACMCICIHTHIYTYIHVCYVQSTPINTHIRSYHSSKKTQLHWQHHTKHPASCDPWPATASVQGAQRLGDVG